VEAEPYIHQEVEAEPYVHEEPALSPEALGDVTYAVAPQVQCCQRPPIYFSATFTKYFLDAFQKFMTTYTGNFEIFLFVVSSTLAQKLQLRPILLENIRLKSSHRILQPLRFLISHL
jgi:hypothetical protein